ncbi:MAG: hypothetical protein HY721_00355 [Planctomycetes bacterium]|nr:hypothetical protein [Planctomycetota bacterium]
MSGVLESIESLDDGKWFGAIFVDKGVIRFPSGENPARADDETRASGVAFVNSVFSGAGSCDLPGLLVALQFAEKTAATSNVIFYVTDGGGTCPGSTSEGEYLTEMRRVFTEANRGLAQLHTVAPVLIGETQEQHLRDFAELNGGQFHQIPPR